MDFRATVRLRKTGETRHISITGSSTKELFHQLERTLETTISSALIKDEASARFVPFLGLPFDAIPRQFIVLVESGTSAAPVVPRHQPTTTSLAGRFPGPLAEAEHHHPHHPQPVLRLTTLRARIVEYLRSLLLPMYRCDPPLITKDDIVVLCSSVMYDYMIAHGLTEEDLDEDHPLSLPEGAQRELRALVGRHVKLPTTTNDSHSQEIKVGRTTPKVAATPVVVTPVMETPRTPVVEEKPSNGALVRTWSKGSGGRHHNAQHEDDDGGGGGIQHHPPSHVSLIESVQYVSAGRFPDKPSQSAAADHFGGLEVTLSPPTQPSPDHDTFLVGRVQSRHTVRMTWWIAVGAQRRVIDADSLHRNGSITTFQVSDEGCLLIVRKGTLVSSQQYHVHVTVGGELTRTIASAQVSFTVHRKGSLTDTKLLVESGVTASHSSHSAGYYGDVESGTWFTGMRLHNQTTTPGTTTDSEADVIRSLPATATTAARLAAGTQLLAMKHPLGLTFQEQLRLFFLQSVEPLFELCQNPTLSRDEFRDLVKTVAAKWWNSRPATELLDEATCGAILKDVKELVLQCRVADERLRHTSTDIPTTAQRPHFEHRVR